MVPHDRHGIMVSDIDDMRKWITSYTGSPGSCLNDGSFRESRVGLVRPATPGVKSSRTYRWRSGSVRDHVRPAEP